jgi:hypothetical protein
MATPNPTTEEASILAVVKSLLSALPLNSLSALLAPTIPGGGAQTLRANQLTTQRIESLCSQILLIPGNKQETFHDIAVKIDRTGRLAMVWAESKVSMEGVVVIEGTNALTLHKLDGEWRISGISDVSRAVEGREGDVGKMYEGVDRGRDADL